MNEEEAIEHAIIKNTLMMWIMRSFGLSNEQKQQAMDNIDGAAQ